mgnify:CR=1 FL=1
MSGTTGQVPLQDVVADQLITPTLWNGEFANVGDLLDAAGCGGHSDTDSDAQIQTAPYPGSVLSKATSIAGELERLRYQLAQVLGTDYWYKPAATDLTSVGDVVVPVGSCIDYPTATAPNSSWHLADGTAISRAGYPALFTLLGTTFGAGDGTTTFNLPDYRNRMSIGAGSTYAVATTGGSATHTLTKSECPSGLLTLNDPGHSHSVSVTDPGHSHGVTDSGHTHVERGYDTAGGTAGRMITNNGTGTLGNSSVSTASSTTGLTVNSTTTGISASSGSATTGASLTDNGGNSAHSILNPYISMYKMIRVL